MSSFAAVALAFIAGAITHHALTAYDVVAVALVAGAYCFGQVARR